MSTPAGVRGTPRRDFDFLVVGGGATASTMASLLIATKLAAPGRVAILAPASRPAAMPSSVPDADTEWGLRVLALSRASRRLLEICGAWQLLPVQKFHAYTRMCVWDACGDADGADALRFDCAEIGEPNLGCIVDGRSLQKACARAALNAGVVFIDASIRQIVTTDADQRVRLSDGRELLTALLIVADGSDSHSRSLLGIEMAGHGYDQDALVAHVSTAKAHGDVARQRFLRTGPLAFLPLPDGRSSIVWSAVRIEAKRLCALDPAAFASELTRASGGVLGECVLTTAVASFPLKLQYAVEYAAPRAVLVGDAAHTVHPLAGQGLNLGLLDCAALASVLSAAADPVLFGERRVLRRYERWRRSENLAAAAALDGLERLFANGNPVIGRIRSAGLGMVDRLPFLKRRLAERALGLSGDIPRFLRRETAPLGG